MELKQSKEGKMKCWGTGLIFCKLQVHHTMKRLKELEVEDLLHVYNELLSS